MTAENQALWLPKRGGKFEVGAAPYTQPAADEVVVRVRAVAVNPIDAMPGFAYRLVLPWLNFPAVVGSDVAGEVVDVGSDVTRLHAGDRVVGNACGIERNRNRSAEGAFQHFVVLKANMTTAIPDDLSFQQAAVLPLAMSTAATGLFQHDHLALALPTPDATDTGETILVWGGSTSVGSNAIQLGRHAGYRVIATSSPRNFEYVRSLGAFCAVDYNSPTAVDEIVDAIAGGPLAGTIAIGGGSLAPTLAVTSRVPGSRRIASAQPGLVTRIQSVLQRRKGVHVSSIWGGSLKDNEVGPAIYVDFLGRALAGGTYKPAPEAVIVGEGLEKIPEALARLRAGVSAKKLVVSL